MKLSDIRPRIAAAHPYLYNGSIYERRRRGYNYGFHLFTSEGAVQAGGALYPVVNGTLLTVPPGCPHAFIASPDRPLTAYNIYAGLFPEPYSAQPHWFAYDGDPFDAGRLACLPECRELDSLPAIRHVGAGSRLSERFAELVALYESGELYARERAEAGLYVWLLDGFAAAALQADRPADPRIRRLLRQLEETPELTPPPEQWPKLCGLGPSHFYKRFREETGVSPKQYLIRSKLKRAAERLTESSLSVTDIAEEFGYASLHFFSRQFKEIYGCSPVQYRAKNRQHGYETP